MKRICNVMLALLLSMVTYASNPEIRYMRPAQYNRAEIFLPQVNGYNIYKADLHVHSIYSDGHQTPELRVREAWFDGLDIIAITEHLESRKREQEYLNFVKGYTGWKSLKAKNWWVYQTPPDEDGILADLNTAYQSAVKTAEKFGMTLIPGIEITREPTEFGHFNILFLEDANRIYAPDPIESLRNARKQNALIMHNHPGWSCTTNAKTDFQKKVYQEGLIDGVEVANGREFYPNIIDRCLNENLFMCANTDLHDGSADSYGAFGHRRTMTLILAHDNSVESVREALEKRRTIAYCAGHLCGEESMLKSLFTASVKATLLSVDKVDGTSLWRFTNNSSFSYRLAMDGLDTPMEINPLSTVAINIPVTDSFKVVICNMWYGENSHPIVML